MDYVFLILVLLSFYSYFIYPLLLMMLPERKHRAAQEAEAAAPVLSLIVTAHNEEARIREKLANSVAIDYPADRFEIIVASDCSTDTTDEIVESYHEQGVRLVRADQRKGKEYAQWCAIQQARGDILVFSDVATRIPDDALKKLVAYFLDPDIGAASSEDRFVSNDGRIVGEGAYVKYEMWLRRLESAHAGLVGLSGSFFAARKAVCQQWDIYSPSDFNTALNCAQQGFVAVTCPDVVGIYKDVKDPALEFNRKVRTVIRGMTAIRRHPVVLNPAKLGLFAIQVWSHKIMRWAVPWLLAGLLVTNIALAGRSWLYDLTLIAQLLFYGIAVAGWRSEPLRENTLVRIVFFFVQTNLALANAMLSFAAGKRMTVWTPSQR